MKKSKGEGNKLTKQEQELVEGLRKHPELREQFQTKLDLTGRADEPLKMADEVEGLLVEAVRRLGHTTMGDWAAQAEARLGEELKKKDSSVHISKKKR